MKTTKKKASTTNKPKAVSVDIDAVPANESVAKPPQVSPAAKPALPDALRVKLDTLVDIDGRFQVDKMDLASLRGTLADIKKLGLPDVKAFWKPEDDEDKLRKRLKRALTAINGVPVLQALAEIQPDKVSCKGIFIDLRDPLCISCTERDECRSLYLKNTQDLFNKHKAARVAEATANTVVAAKADVAATTDADIAAITKVAKKAAKEPTGGKESAAKKPLKADKYVYNAEREIEIVAYDKNPIPKTPDFAVLRSLVFDIRKKQPKTLGALRAIVADHYDVKSDVDFKKIWTNCLTADDVPVIRYAKGAK